MKLKKNQIYYVLYTVCLAILFLIFGKNIYMVPNSTVTILNNMSPVAVGEIIEGTKVEQTFGADSNTLETISIKFATYQRTNTSQVQVELWQVQNNKKIQQWIFSSEELRDNSFKMLHLEEALHGINKEQFKIIITSPDAVSGNAITIIASGADSYVNGELFVDGTKQQGDAFFKLDHFNKNGLLKDGAQDTVVKFDALQFVSAYLFYHILILVVFFCLKSAVKKIKNTKIRKNVVVAILRNEFIIFVGIIAFSCFYKLVFRNNLQFTRRNAYHMLFVFVAATMCNLLYVYRKEIVEKIEYLTFLLIVLLGTFFVIVYPNNIISWDEEIHYRSTLTLSHMGYANLNRADEDLIINYSEVVVGDVTLYYSIPDRNEKDKDLNNESKETSLAEVSMNYKNSYNYVAYIPASITIALCRLVHMPYTLTFMLGRLTTLFVYASVIYLAMKKIKKGKLLIATIAMIPTCMFQATTYGYDYWVICFFIYAIAWLFSELQQPEKKVSLKEILCMIGVFVIGLGPKAIYFPIMIWMLFLKKDKFVDEKQYKLFRRILVASIVCVIISFALPFLISGLSAGEGQQVGDSRGGSGVNSIEQLKFILCNPIQYAKILFEFLKSYLSLDNAFGYLTYWAYLGRNNGAVLYIVVLVVVILLGDAYDHECKLLNTKEKIGIHTVVFITICMVASVLYISFTPVAFYTINGCQPRYLLPLLFPFCYALSNHKVKWDGNRNLLYGFVMGILSMLLLSSCWNIILERF